MKRSRGKLNNTYKGVSDIEVERCQSISHSRPTLPFCNTVLYVLQSVTVGRLLLRCFNLLRVTVWLTHRHLFNHRLTLGFSACMLLVRPILPCVVDNLWSEDKCLVKLPCLACHHLQCLSLTMLASKRQIEPFVILNRGNHSR